MKVWLLKVGEPLPTDRGAERPNRTGIIAARLSARGHDVTWWCSTFNHATKIHRFPALQREQVAPRLRTVQLHGRSYRRNVSIARILNHRDEARQFAQEAEREERPDLILCAYPTIDLSVEAVRYGLRHGVPVVLDVRDLWPDIFIEVFPSWIRPLARAALASFLHGKSFAFRNAAAIVGSSEGFVDWGLAAAGRARTGRDRAFPHGYPVAALTSDKRAEALAFWSDTFGGTLPKHLVCFFGNFSDHVVDLDTVIAAARRLQAEKHDAVFVLCGVGPSHARVSQLAGGLANVVLPGRVGAAQIRVLMEHSSAGLVPYGPRWDFVINIPNKAIEYLSAGLPIITCLKGELESLIRQNDCGLVYESGSARALADAVRSLFIDESARRRQQAAAFALFDRVFDGERVYSDYSAHLEQVAHLGANT